VTRSSREIFLRLVERFRSLDQLMIAGIRDFRDLEARESHLIRHLPAT